MFGDSYQAMTQYAAASSGNPHLVAIFPCSASFDMYDALVYPGGVYNTGFTSALPRALAVLETMVVPVDRDTGGALLARTVAERRKRTLGQTSAAAFRRVPLRDGRRAEGPRIWDEVSLYRLLDRINASGVAVYGSNGWFDIFTRDMFLWHANLEVPRRLQVRPLHHLQMNRSGPDLDLGAEVQRWFDYWLKGIDNGIMDEPPVQYWVMGAPPEEAWRTAETWPPPERRTTRLYLAGAGAGAGDAAPSPDGLLRAWPPSVPGGQDAYRVDYATTSGVDSRWSAIVGAGVYGDMGANDERALTYTTPPLDRDVEVTGHPVVHLWVATRVPDVDLFVYLEEVDAEGRSTYVTEGNLRASHRRLGRAPFDNLGLPYQRSHASDLAPMPPGEPVELRFDLLPTAKRFPRGSRIRLAITGADADNFETPRRDPPPEIRVFRSPERASYLALPTLPSGGAR
jgi:putative CocE/NonD family hydrolase